MIVPHVSMSSSPQNERLTARLEASNRESCSDPTQVENTRKQVKAKESDKDKHTLSPVFVDILQSGWVVNDNVYMPSLREYRVEVSKQHGYMLVDLENPSVRLHHITLCHINYFFLFRFPLY